MKDQPVVLVYTMTGGLGDYLVMGDVMRKAKLLLPRSQCLIVHRANPHIKQWPEGSYKDAFFNIHSPVEMLRLSATLYNFRRKSYCVFGLQLSPGSLQGYVLHRWLKFIRAMDYIVDFNLINTDIITPAQGQYILNRHLNQLSDLFKINIPAEYFHLKLPLVPLETQGTTLAKKPARRLIGIHPWSRRGTGSFFWPLENWIEIIRYLLRQEDVDLVILGKDRQFAPFERSLRDIFAGSLQRIYFMPSNSVQDLAKTVNDLDILLTVNTAVVHISYALDKKMIILTGPTLDFWNPTGPGIHLVRDDQALLIGADRSTRDERFPQVARIKVGQVIEAYESIK